MAVTSKVRMADGCAQPADLWVWLENKVSLRQGDQLCWCIQD